MRRHYGRPGLSRRGERLLDAGAALLIAFLCTGWIWSVSHARDMKRSGVELPAPRAMLAASLTRASAPSAAYLTDAALSALVASVRGVSGGLQARTALPGEALQVDTAGGGKVVYVGAGERTERPATAGIRAVAVAVGNALRPLGNLHLITMVPFSAKKNGRVGLYFLGTWPAEHGAHGPSAAPPDRYAAPSGFIQVTRENRDTRVSDHFRLRDFVTHDQPDVWPKYVVLQLRNVDKLELVLQDLESRGIRTSGVVVMSGFRTPQYNEAGGNTAGRAGNSRHMYGDAADVYIDNDRDGVMDDLNGDGQVNAGDARLMQEAVDRVERTHPELVGGAGVYVACCGHGPFIHIDSRGYRARWIGSGGG